MCNQNSCFGGCGCWIIIAIIILCLFWGGTRCGRANTQHNNGCRCGGRPGGPIGGSGTHEKDASGHAGGVLLCRDRTIDE